MHYQDEKRPVTLVHALVDTADLLEDDSFDYLNLKKNYLNNMISWSFLKKLSDFNQWPLGCIGNFVENSLKEDVGAKNIAINVQAYNKYVYTSENGNTSGESEQIPKNALNLSKNGDYTNSILVLSITDDGKGLSIKEFNQVFYSFSVNEKKEHNYFKYGISLKTSAIRLANSFMLVSKTEDDFSVGLMSKNLQTKLDTDYIMTVIVNYVIQKEGEKKYVPRSNFAQQSLNLILNETKFMFKDEEAFISYVDTINTGTHIILYDLKQVSPAKSDLNKLENYELLFDFEEKDILFNYFDIQISERSFIDASLVTYLKFLFLKNRSINISVLGQKVDIKNPLLSIMNLSKTMPGVGAVKIANNLRCDDTPADCICIEGEIYKGILFNHSYFASLANICNFENSFNEKEIFNGILLYRDNRLVCRLDQDKLGDICYFVRKFEDYEADSDKSFFAVSGYIELPAATHHTLSNKTVN